MEPTDQAVALAIGVAAGEVVPGQVVVVVVIGEQVPADHQDRMGDGDGAFFFPIRRASRQNWADR